MAVLTPIPSVHRSLPAAARLEQTLNGENYSCEILIHDLIFAGSQQQEGSWDNAQQALGKADKGFNNGDLSSAAGR